MELVRSSPVCPNHLRHFITAGFCPQKAVDSIHMLVNGQLIRKGWNEDVRQPNGAGEQVRDLPSYSSFGFELQKDVA